jgi:hypothetical protein
MYVTFYICWKESNGHIRLSLAKQASFFGADCERNGQRRRTTFRTPSKLPRLLPLIVRRPR